jgi:hypothetical protein
MEQLFKHEGMCVWSDEQYAFMKHARKQWPKGCASTGQTKTIGGTKHTLYYNIKPLRSGRIAFGLYTDEQCIEEYSANTKTVESIIGNVWQNADSHDNGEGDSESLADSLASGQDLWDDAFDVWHYCHPCVAHDVENTDGSKYANITCYEHNDEEDDYYYYENENQNQRKLGFESCPRGEIFECYDDGKV